MDTALGVTLIIFIISTVVLAIHSTSMELKLRDIKELSSRYKQNVLNANERLRYTENLMKLMHENIDHEVTYLLYQYAVKEKLYPMLKIDEDIDAIATRIYQSFVALFYREEDLSLSNEYLMRTIVIDTTQVLSSAAIEFNNQMRTQ